MADEDDDEHRKFIDDVTSCNWQHLETLLRKAGEQRAKQLVTSLLREDQASALTLAAGLTPPLVSAPTSHPYLPPAELGEDRPAGSAPTTSLGDVLETCKILAAHGAELDHQDNGGLTALHWAAATHKVPLAAWLLSAGAKAGVLDVNGHSPLHAAVRAGSHPCVALLLQHDRQALTKDGHATPLLTLAIQQGHRDICRLLLESGADVNAQEKHTFRTPLHYALYLNRLDIFALLLSYQPDLHAKDHRGTTVVHRCCAGQEPDFLSHVLRSRCSHLSEVIEMEDDEGATPVIIACQFDNLANVQQLLENGASASVQDGHGRTALHYCVENASTDCADLLLRTDPSLLSKADHEGLTPLHMAVIAGNAPLIRLLLKRGASLHCRDQEDHTVAHWATVCGHSEVLDVLLEYGADLSVADRHRAYPVHYAAQMLRVPSAEGDTDCDNDGCESEPRDDGLDRSGSTLLLRKLLANQVSPEVRDKDHRTPILWAASAGNAEACRVLVEAGADVNSADKDGLSALHCAASRGHHRCVRVLVSACEADVDPVDSNQCTPLFYAVTLGHEQCAEALLELGALPNHTDNNGRTTAHCAAVKGSRDSLEALGKQGVDLWQPTDKGEYPLHEAAQAGHVDVIDYLLQVRGDGKAIDTGNKDGRTCLHIAALTNNLWLAKFLLDHHADVNAVMRNKGKNYTPYDAAVAKGNKEAADYLQSRGGVKADAVRPPSGNRPSSSRVKDRPLSSKAKDRPSSSKAQKTQETSKEKRRRKKKIEEEEAEESVKPEQNGDDDHGDDHYSQTTDDGEQARPVVAVVVTRDGRPPLRSASSHTDEPPSSAGKKSDTSTEEDDDPSDSTTTARSSSSITQSRQEDEKKKRKLKTGANDKQKVERRRLKAVDDDQASSRDKSQKNRTNSTEPQKSASRRQPPKTDDSKPSDPSKTSHKQRTNDCVKSSDAEQTSDVPSESTAQKSHDTSVSSSSGTNSGSGTNSSSSNTTHSKSTTESGGSHRSRTLRQSRARSRSHSRSSGSSRSRSHSSSRSRSRSSTVESTSSKRKADSNTSTNDHVDGDGDGDGLNLFSDNDDHSDREEEVSAGSQRGRKPAAEDVQTAGEKDGGDQEEVKSESQDAQDRDKKKRPRSSHLISSVQASVRRFEQDRRSIRQLQQLRRAQIYNSHSRSVALFHSLLHVYGVRNGAPAWDMILQEPPTNRDLDEGRPRSSAKLTGREEHKGSLLPSPKDGSHQVTGGGNTLPNTERDTPAGRRQGSAVSASAVSAASSNAKEKEETGKKQHNDTDSPISPGPSPRKQKHNDYGDTLINRRLQRQRTEDMQRLLLKAYRPALPQDLFNNGRPFTARPATSERSVSPTRSLRPSRPSTSRNISARLSPSQGRPASVTSSRGRSSSAMSGGMSQAQFRAAQKSFTIMTSYGSRSVRPASEHHTMWFQRQDPSS